ncbi:MAG TPA: DNA polymerase III subunit alpha, partial [Sphingomonas sp.]
FGFYFSAHPTDRYRHLATAMGARSFAELSSYPAPADGGRTESRMAVLVESAGWRTSAKGRRYMMATCSDASAQFVATCFDDAVAADLEGAARTGSCGFVRVELDRKPGEETPRVTIKHIRPFEDMQDTTKLKLVVAVDHPAALDRLARICAVARGGRGELVLNAAIDGGVAELRLARDVKIDAELAALIERVPGVGSVKLLAGETVPLALVS